MTRGFTFRMVLWSNEHCSEKAGTMKYSFVLTEVAFQQISDKLKCNASEK
jgi:hypothetical protein